MIVLNAEIENAKSQMHLINLVPPSQSLHFTSNANNYDSFYHTAGKEESSEAVD